jgi:hypothetical protein
LINSGTISPGTASTTGTLSISGNLTNTGIIQTKIAGTATGQYDTLAVTGNVTLGGTLNASTINGYAPANLDFASFLTATGTASGTFATVTAPGGFAVGYNLAANEAARLIYSAGSKTFTNAAGGLNWDNVGNWTGSALPAASDDVLLSSGYAVSHSSGSDTIGSLTINSGNSLAVSGGLLSVTRNTTVGGSLTTSGGTLNLNGGLANTGTLGVSAGTLNLAGNYTPANLGTLVGTGGAARLTGTLTNAGSTLTLSNTTGNLDIVGTVTGGTLATASGSTAKYLSSSGTLDGVTLAGNLQVSPNGNLTIRNGLTLSNGRVTLGDAVTSGAGVNMYWDGTQTIGGNGEILLNAPGGASLVASYHATGSNTLTLDSGVAVRSIAPVYNLVGSFDSRDNLINRGTISAQGASTALNVMPGATLANTGTLMATAGRLSFSGMASNAGIIQVVAGANIGSDNVSLTNGTTGIIKGSGNFSTGPWPTFGTLINSGTISPGTASTTGTLSISGNLTNTGIIQTKIAGTAAGQYDVLSVTGNVTLGGTLNSAIGNGLVLEGNRLNVITASALNGSFSTVTLTGNGAYSIASKATAFAITSTVVSTPTTASPSVTNEIATITQSITQSSAATASQNTLSLVAANPVVNVTGAVALVATAPSSNANTSGTASSSATSSLTDSTSANTTSVVKTATTAGSSETPSSEKKEEKSAAKPVAQAVVVANTTVQKPADQVVQVEKPKGSLLICKAGG